MAGKVQKKEPALDADLRARSEMSRVDRVEKDPSGRFIIVWGVHDRQVASCVFRRDDGGVMRVADKWHHDDLRECEAHVRAIVAGFAPDWRVSRDVANGFPPICTYLLARCGVFQPVMRRSQPHVDEAGDDGWTATRWGRARVEGHLTAVHAGLLAAIMRVGRPTLLESGEVDVAVDLRRLFELGVPRGGYVYDVLDDIYHADIWLDAPATASRGPIQGHGRLLTETFEEGGRRPARGRRGGSEMAADRKVLRVRFGRWFVRLWSVDLCLYEEDDFVRALGRMKSGPARMAALFCSTHAGEVNGGYTAKFLFKTLWGIEREPTRGELREFCRGLHRDAAALKDVGFCYEAGRLRKL